MATDDDDTQPCSGVAKPPPLPGAETVLDEAARLTSGPRQRDYDHPLENHQRIADAWALYIQSKYGIVVPLKPEDAAHMMILVKIAREAHTPKRDNIVDICGYARCIERMRAKSGMEGYVDLKKEWCE